MGLQGDLSTNSGDETVVALTAAPYALMSASASNLLGTLPATALLGTYSGAVTLDNAANGFTGNGAGLTGLNASSLSSGTVPEGRLPASVARTDHVWLLGGSAGTAPGKNFVGTSDGQPLQKRGNNQLGLVVQTNGNVGVGTTNPAAKLDVTGNTIVMGVLGVGTTNPGAAMNTQFDAVGRASFRTDTSDTTKALNIDQFGTAHRIYAGSTSGSGYDLILGTYPNGHINQLVPKQTGNVGIGRSPTANKLELEGNASKTAAGSWLANSDVRIKQNIQPITGATEKLARVRLVSFRYTDECRRQHPAVGPPRR